MDGKELQNALSYLVSEINRIETIAGTLSSVENEHYNKLIGFDHNGLKEIAIEEQSSSRQLGTIRQMCLNISERINNLETHF